MARIKQLKSGQFIVKSNTLIEARYRLSIQESYVIFWLLTQISPDDEDFKVHRLRVEDFAEIIQVNVGNRYSELRKITKHLMQRVMEIYSPDEDKTIQVSWLSSTEYEHKKGYVSLRFDPALKPYLLQLSGHFTKIDIVDVLKLKSIHSVRIFELLLQYISIGNRKINIGELRSYCGIEKEEYAGYGMLKRKVIERAKTEINEKTGYEIDYEEIKESRKVAEIKWTIQKKTHFEKGQAEKAELITKELRSKNVLVDELMEYGFSKIAANRILKNNQESNVANAIKAVDLQVQKGKAKNPKAMLETAIKEGWHPEKYRDKPPKKAC